MYNIDAQDHYRYIQDTDIIVNDIQWHIITMIIHSMKFYNYSLEGRNVRNFYYYLMEVERLLSERPFIEVQQIQVYITREYDK